jgi:hypothetical protein
MLSEDEKAIARQSYRMYRNRWRRNGAKSAAEKGYSICIGWLTEGGREVTQAKEDEYRAYLEGLADGEIILGAES